MSSLLPTFSKPESLLLIPVACFFLWLLYRQQKRGSHWHKLLPPAFQPWLLQQAAGYRNRAVWLLLAAAALLAGTALSAPQLPGYSSSKREVPAPLVIVIEMTPDMLASDLPPSRLHLLRSKTADMLQAQLPGQTAIVVYAGSAHMLLPLSTDPEMANNLLQALHPSLLPRPGRDAAAAIAKALALLHNGANGSGRIALLTSNLSAKEQAAITRQLRKHPHVSLGIIGIGTRQGAPVPDPVTGQFNSSQPLSRLHEDSLQQLAQHTGATYARLQYSNADLLQTGLFARNTAGTLRATSNPSTHDQGYWLLIPLLFVLAPLARKGWLFALLPLLMLLPPSAPALATDSGQSPMQQVKQDPVTALQHLQDPLWLGIAAYHADNYQLAHDYFSGLDSVIAHYNRGNSLMQLGDYQSAAAAYRQALVLAPELQQAQDNLMLARRLQQRASTAATPLPGSAADTLTPAPGEQEQTGKTATLQHPDPIHQYGSLDTWLQQIPDNPAVLLKRKFHQELSQPAP